jgi:outer membrane receptor protein involved in Fe transport
VTANKRDESINKVGLTIKALGAAQLEQQRVVTLQDLASAVPGLTFSQTENATPVYTLRGIGFYDTALAGYPAVSVYLDQVPLPFPVMTTLTLFDIERVEVLKGPQGTLFGQNATGGAINYIAAKPTQDMKAGADLTYARFNTFGGNAFISGPITSNLLARLAVSATSGDGWQKSISRPNDRNGAPDTFAARFLTDWRPTDRLRVQLNLNGWRDRTQPSAAQFVAFIPSFTNYIPNPLPKPLIPNAVSNPRLADWSPDTPPRADNRLLQAAARIDYDVTDAIQLTSITSYIKYRQRQAAEGDGLPEHRNDQIQNDGDIRSFSQEIRLANNSSSVFRWTLGANYSHDNVSEVGFINFSDDTASYTPSLPDHLPANGQPGRWMGVGYQSHQVMNNYAGFASGEYSISRAFTLKAGVRYTEADRRGDNCGFGGTHPEVEGPTSAVSSYFHDLGQLLSGGVPRPAPGPGGCSNTLVGPLFLPGSVHTVLDEHNVSWRAGVDWKPVDGFLGYVNVSKGYKAGSLPTITGSVPLAFSPALQESVLTYEAGVKARLFDRKLDINAAIFRSDYDNKQIKSKLFDPIFRYLLALVNIPKSRIQGIEVEATARPFAGLTIGGAATYLDSKLLNTIGPDGLPLISNANTQADFAGNPIPYTPKWNLAGNMNYSFRLGDSSNAFVGWQVAHRSKANASIGNEPVMDLKAYTTLDLQAGVDFGDGKYKLMVWGKNVTNEFYVTNRNFSFDGPAQYIGQPATYGVTLSFRY